MAKLRVTIEVDTVTGTATVVPATTPVPVPDPTPTPTPTGAVVVQTLAKQTNSVYSASWKNTGGATQGMRSVVIAVRPPGASHAAGPFDKDVTKTLTTLAAGETVSATITFPQGTVAAGKWTLYPTWQDAAGAWHDGADMSVDVSGTPVPVPDPTPTPTPDPTPVPAGSFRYAMKARVGSQPWQADWGGSDPMQGTGTAIDPKFLADYKTLGATCFRCMDAIPVNGSTTTNWSQRVQPGAKQSSPGIAIEYLIDICNQGSMDLWLCHPYLADDDYMHQCATLVKSRLNADLRVFTELSNEVWNGQFLSYQQAISAGQKIGVPGSNQYYQGIAHEMYRALQMYQLYADVFGAAAMGSKVIRTFSESGNFDLTTQALANVYQSAKWNPSGQKIDMLAVAPYIDGGTDGAKETLAHWNASVDSAVSGEPIATAKSQAAKYGIPYVGMYELGMGHYTNAQAFAANPIAYDAYTYMLNKFLPAVNGPCCLYTSHGTWQSGGAWGLFSSVGQDINNAPKARAVRDYTASHK